MGMFSTILLMFLFATLLLIIGLVKKSKLLKSLSIVLFAVSAVMLFFVWSSM